jgi:4-amino-4-deoxy-L-arabinose transferase-like glycosyltransferase
VHVAALAFGLAAPAVTGVLVAATLRLRGTALVLAAYVIAWAEVVGLTELLSLVDAVGRMEYLVGVAVVLAGAAADVLLVRAPLPRPPRLRLDLLRGRPELVLLGAVVAAALAYETFLAVATPPNNYDSLTYHLTRAVAWLQQGHVGYFDAETARANAFPANGEIGILYTLALLGRDRVAALPQLLAELAVLVAVHGIARRLGFARPAALLAALLTATLSEVALESVTTQNDLVVASFVAAAVFFVLDGSRRLLPLAGLAVGLAIGTKLTGLLALPIVIACAVALLPRRRLAEVAIFSIVGFAALGAFTYVENVVQTGHPLGVVPEADAYRAHVSATGTVSTASRVYWRFVDFSGLDPPPSLTDGLERVGKNAFAALHVDPNPQASTVGAFSFSPQNEASEDTSYFGVLGFLLVVPLSLGVLAAWASRRVPRAAGLLAAALPVFVLVIALTQRYDRWLGRFMLIPVVLTMPLAAYLYPRRLLVTLAVALGAGGLLAVHLHNEAKPVGLDGSGVIWQMPRTEAQALLAGPGRALTAADRQLPEDARVGVVLGNNDPTYLLYGPQLGRRLIPLAGRDVVAQANRRGLRWVVVHATGPATTGRGWCSEQLSPGWQLLVAGHDAKSRQRRSLLGSRSATARVDACRST